MPKINDEKVLQDIRGAITARLIFNEFEEVSADEIMALSMDGGVDLRINLDGQLFDITVREI